MPDYITDILIVVVVGLTLIGGLLLALQII